MVQGGDQAILFWGPFPPRLLTAAVYPLCNFLPFGLDGTYGRPLTSRTWQK